jgi:hypothetical protein
MTSINNAMRKRMLSAVARAWARGAPLSMRPRDGERFIARALSRGNIRTALNIENELFAAVKAREIHEVVIAEKPLTFGLKPAEVNAEILRKFRGTSAHRSQTVESSRKNHLRKLVRKSCGSAEVALQPIENIAERKCGSSPIPSVAGNKRTAGARRAAPTVLFRRGRQVKLGTPFAVGDVLFHRGQRFVCAEVIPCIRKDGTPSAWTVWRGECADCQAPFDVKAYSKTFRPVQRRCDLHKAPLCRTKFGKGRRRKRRAAQ